jgi:hypothetical protein
VSKLKEKIGVGMAASMMWFGTGQRLGLVMGRRVDGNEEERCVEIWKGYSMAFCCGWGGLMITRCFSI